MISFKIFLENKNHILQWAKEHFKNDEIAKNFIKWFGKSKVVDMEGNPLVVYKSMNPYDWTKEENPLLDKIQRPNEFPAFNKGEKGINIAGFFGDIHTSNRFSLGNTRSATFPVFISLQRPYIVDAKGEKSGSIQFGPTGIAFRDAMRSGKYDGAIIKNTSDENDVYITTKPEQSKSAIGNKGTFNKKDPRLIESKKQFMENQNKKHLVGTCVNSFDEDGKCDNINLPYRDTTQFAQAEENATEITKDQFINNVNLPDSLKYIKAIYLHDKDNDVFMLYDDQKDVHYFFA
jgi:hypothetical protein